MYIHNAQILGYRMWPNQLKGFALKDALRKGSQKKQLPKKGGKNIKTGDQGQTLKGFKVINHLAKPGSSRLKSRCTVLMHISENWF